jgi:pimeloyl-ACP methyl ester carboxylesterase
MSASPAKIPGFDGKWTTIAGVRLHYWIGGNPEGSPVILWHGFLSTAYAWRDVAPALAKAGLSVLVPDMRGYGDSDKPPGNDGYDARSLAEECRALVAAIGFGKGKLLIHAAHDMVAMVAKNVEAHTLTGCGHFMTEERPEFVADHIVALIARVAAARAKKLTV